MKIYELQREHRERFPYRTLRSVAWALILLAVVVFILGVVDLGWTASNYGQLGCVSDWTLELQSPCMHANLGWTWASAPIWTSIFVIVSGVFGARISRWRYRSLRFWRNSFGITAALVAILFAPMLIVLSALEIHYGTGIFYYTPVGQSRMHVEDPMKLALPIVIAILGLFELIVAMVALTTVLCCAPIMRDDEYDIYPRTRSSNRSYRTSYHEPSRNRYAESVDGYRPAGGPSGTWPRGGRGFNGPNFGGFSNFLPLNNPKPLPYAFNTPPQVFPVHTRNQVALPQTDGLQLMPTTMNRGDPLNQRYHSYHNPYQQQQALQPYQQQQPMQPYQQQQPQQPDGYFLRTHPERPFVGWVKEYPNMAGEMMR